MSHVYLNGDFIETTKATVSIFDRGFLFADGVYEVVPYFNNKPFQLNEHLDRLKRSLHEISLDFDVDKTDWTAIIDHLAQHSDNSNFSIYIQITRGADIMRSHLPTQKLTPTILVLLLPLKTKKIDTSKVVGQKAITQNDIRWQRCDIKSIALLPNIMFKQKAQQQNAVEAILVKENFVTEGASSNVFIVKDGVVITHPINEYILGGITRFFLIESLKAHNIPIKEERILKSDLYTADEVWLTSSTQNVSAVTQVDDKIIGSGKVGPLYLQVAEYFNIALESL